VILVSEGMEEFFLEVPIDPNDPNYALSFEFDELSSAKDFFEHYGYVVRLPPFKKNFNSCSIGLSEYLH
jgi:hypothetical protein